MAGIYIHIPFCKQRCHYCDFYKTTQVLKKPELVKAVVLELKNRKEWLQNNEVNTIYFGGGTPSLLSYDELSEIFEAIYTNYSVAKTPEITLESNPDDISVNFLALIKNTPINRLSIGIQSFIGDHLQLMNRRHTSQQAVGCVKMAQDMGFTNISTDLIYGIPGLTLQNWEHNLNQMAALNIQHLSAYHLTYEQGTVFDTMLKKGALIAIDEEQSIIQFKALIEWARVQGFEHYEISNFALPGLYSKHNTSYWQQVKYLGIGPSAHSYSLESRQWNVANLSKYLVGVNTGRPYFEHETLTELDKYNEFLMTGIRTRWGIDLFKLEAAFGKMRVETLMKQAQPFILQGKIVIRNNCLILTDDGIFLSDAILQEFIEL